MADDLTGWRAAADALRERIDELDWSHQTPRRMRILEAFLTVATRDGYGAVTMRSLGRELDIKAPSLYKHFPDGRDDLVAESLRWNQYGFFSALLEAVDGVEGPAEAWDAIVAEHVRRQLGQPEAEMFDLLLAQDRLGGILHPDVRREVEHILDLYEQLLVRIATDMGHGESARTAVPVVMSLLDGASTWGRRGPAQDVVRTAQATSRAVLGAVDREHVTTR